MAKPIKIYWDTCAWLGLLNGEDDKSRELDILYKLARDGRYEIWTSTLSMLECRFTASEKNTPRLYEATNNATIRSLFQQTFIKPVGIALDIADRAREIWRQNPEITKYQDAVHIASALRWNIETMHTYDYDDLLVMNGRFRCRNGNELTICYPDQTTDGPLFSNAKKPSKL